MRNRIVPCQRDAGTRLATALRRRPFSACNKGNRRCLHAGNMSSSEDISYPWAETVDFFRIDEILFAETENDIQSYHQTMIRRKCFPRYELGTYFKNKHDLTVGLRLVLS